MHANQALEMAREFTPKEPTKDYRVPLTLSLSIELDLIAKIRSKVNEEVGDKTKVSPTEMLIEAAQDIRDSQFHDWGGRPTTDAEVDAIIKREVVAARAKLPVSPKLAIMGEPKSESKKKSGASR